MTPTDIDEVMNVIPSGVKGFTGEKDYVDTSNVKSTHIEGKLDRISYEKRPSRANMEAMEGDVLYAKMANTRKVLLVDSKQSENVFSTGFFVLRPNPSKLLSKYLYYWLRWNGTDVLKDRISHGETQRQLSNSQFKDKFRIPLPSDFTHQREIVSKIERIDSVVSKLIEQERRARLLLASERDLLFKQARDEDYSPLLSVLQHPPYRYPTFYGFKYVDKGIPVLKISNMTEDGKFSLDLESYDHITEEINARYPKTVVGPGDLVLEVRGTYIGKTALVPKELAGSNLSPNTIRLSPNREEIIPEFLWHYTFTSGWLDEIQKGVRNWKLKFGTIKASKIKSMKVPKPTKEKQRIVVDQLGALDSLVAKFSKDAKIANELLQSRLTKTFTS